MVIHDVEEAEGQTPLHPRGARANLAGPKGGYRALEQLRAEGKIKAFGAGINYAVGTHNHILKTTYQRIHFKTGGGGTGTGAALGKGK